MGQKQVTDTSHSHPQSDNVQVFGPLEETDRGNSKKILERNMETTVSPVCLNM